MNNPDFSPLIQQTTLALMQQEPVDENTIEKVFDLILSGAPHIQLAAFLAALATAGEQTHHVTAARSAMISHMTPLEIPPQIKKKSLDIVGTGGDNLQTLNISTTAALLVAACDIPVAKHGNRAVSSQSGAADVLEALGITNFSPEHTAASISKHKFGFMFAPQFPPAMKHVSPVRQALKLPSIFNILGPLCNPAQTPFMIIGAVGDKRQKLMASALQNHVESALVVGNSSGADEILAHGTNSGYLVKNGKISPYEFSPEDAGFRPHDSIDGIKGGDAEYNASKIKGLLSGKEKNTLYYDSVIMTASAALLVAGKVASLREGSLTAANALINKKAANTLNAISSS
jgi:anthranilate phosphoribosyltransferase